MANKVNTLKKMLGSGARPNKYRISFSVPPSVAYSKNDTNTPEGFNVLCKATSFPSVTIGQIEVFQQGRKFMLPGDTSYTNTWTATFYLTEDHAIRKAIMAWMKSVDHWQGNSHSGEPSNIMTKINVEQLDSNGSSTIMYTFNNAFPTELGEITLADDQIDTIGEFDATFTFSDWTTGPPENTSDTVNNPEFANISTKNPIASNSGE